MSAFILLLLFVSKLACARVLRAEKQQAVITNERNGIAASSTGFPEIESKYAGKKKTLENGCKLQGKKWGTYYMWRIDKTKNAWKIGYSTNKKAKKDECTTSRLVRYASKSFEPKIAEFYNIVKCKVSGKTEGTGKAYKTPEKCMDSCFAEMVYGQKLIQKVSVDDAKVKYKAPDVPGSGITEWFEDTKYGNPTALAQAIADWFMSDKNCNSLFKTQCESCDMKSEGPIKSYQATEVDDESEHDDSDGDLEDEAEDNGDKVVKKKKLN